VYLIDESEDTASETETNGGIIILVKNPTWSGVAGDSNYESAGVPAHGNDISKIALIP
jgi:hypothetical protein